MANFVVVSLWLNACILPVSPAYASRISRSAAQSAGVSDAGRTPTARDVMRRVESNQRIQSESVAFEMVLTDKSKFQRRRFVREFRRRGDPADVGDIGTWGAGSDSESPTLEAPEALIRGADPAGFESSLILFDGPPDIRGSALLSKERVDGHDDQWLYLPAVGKIRRIAESGRTDYFLGTDLTFEDFSVEDIDRFAYRFASADTVVSARPASETPAHGAPEALTRPAHVIDAVPVDTSSQRRSQYGVRRLFVDAGRYVILRTEYYDRAGSLIKILTASNVAGYDVEIRHSISSDSGGSNPGPVWRANQIFVDNIHRNHQTSIRVTGRSLLDDFPADFFTSRTLQRGVSRENLPHPPRTIPDTR